MLQMVENRRLDPGKLVHRKIRLEEASGVLEAMDKFGTVGVTVINQY
jgi:alcohol dehydrogenase